MFEPLLGTETPYFRGFLIEPLLLNRRFKEVHGQLQK